MPVQNYDSTHKLIVPPVSFADVNSVFGTSYTKLSQLCQASNIRRWAKYKPVSYAQIDTVTGHVDSNNKWLTSGSGAATWYKATDGRCGMTIKKYTSIKTLCEDVIGDGWEKAWAYTSPSGTTSAPFRLSDFNYYCHSSVVEYDAPFNTFMFGGQSGTVFFIQEDDYISGVGTLYKNQYTNPYIITLSDMWERTGYSSFEDLYFGVAIYRAASSSSSGTVNERITIATAADTWRTSIEHYGTMIRETQRIPKMVFQATSANHVAVPILSKNKFTPTSAVDNTDTTGEFYAVPLPAVNVTVQTVAKTIRITPSVIRASKSGVGITISLRLTATQIEQQGQQSWSGNIHKIIINVFEGGQSPPREVADTYTVPASSAFTPSGSFPKTYDMTLNLNGTTGTDYVQIYIKTDSTQEWLDVGSGTSVSV